MYRYIFQLTANKILPKRTNNLITNEIAGYPSFLKLSIYLHTLQGTKQIAHVSFHRMVLNIKINQLIATVITLLAKFLAKTPNSVLKLSITTFPNQHCFPFQNKKIAKIYAQTWLKFKNRDSIEIYIFYTIQNYNYQIFETLILVTTVSLLLSFHDID